MSLPLSYALALSANFRLRGKTNCTTQKKSTLFQRSCYLMRSIICVNNIWHHIHFSETRVLALPPPPPPPTVYVGVHRRMLLQARLPHSYFVKSFHVFIHVVGKLRSAFIYSFLNDPRFSFSNQFFSGR